MSVPFQSKKATKGNPSINIQITPDILSQFPSCFDIEKYFKHTITFLEFNPPLPPGYVNSTLSFYVFDREDGGCARRVPRDCNNDNFGIKVKFPISQISPTGYTPFLTFNANTIQTHFCTDIQFYYVPVVEILDNYCGVVTLKCLSFDAIGNSSPMILFQDVFQFNGKDIKSSQYYLHVSDSASNPTNKARLGNINVARHGDSITYSQFNNLFVFGDALKAQVLKPEICNRKLFHRLELNVNQAITIEHAALHHNRKEPENIILFGDYQSISGCPLDLGVEAYDDKF
ncbi:hypothetical protein GPJ56_010414 [Histomonas meleagridis]|uniref:uncharacterized protein n=1 Tax=Histomonas meleagridis TaxID=135588 RepID=UPI00355AA443|nr:hypothetical protein GPJ56_010414 [Histomonas meleagridis]KAH0799027.1 hypothetical protein GO595_008179 [Histomonas meleagridis]